MTTTKIEMIEIGKLIADPLNVRKTNKSLGIDALAASIDAQGIRQSLLVRPAEKGMFFVSAGDRRRQALAKLVAEGKKQATDTVPCIVIENASQAEAVEASLVENVHRIDMSPIDEFEAFDALHSEGQTPETIALRFGVSERHVKQRLTLAALHGEILKALKNGEIDMAAAQAFTLAPSKKSQAEVLKQMQENGHFINANTVRRAFTHEHLLEDSELAAMLGKDAYLEAGGKITGDLFTNHAYWISGDVINKLKAERFSQLADQYLADGWAFVNSKDDYKNYYSLNREYPQTRELTKEEEAEFERIEAILEEANWGSQERREAEEAERVLEKATKMFTDEQKAHSGVIICLESGRIDFGMIDPKSAKPIQSNHVNAEGSKDKKDPLALSAALIERLNFARSNATRLKLAEPEQEHTALAALAATLATKSDAIYASYSPIALSVDYVPNLEKSDKIKFPEAFKKYIKFDAAKLVTEIAQLTAQLVNITSNFPGDQKIENLLIETVKPDPCLTFDREDYVTSVGKPVLLAMLADLKGKKFAKDNETAKKADLAKLAMEALQTENGATWLPVQLRNASYKGSKA